VTNCEGGSSESKDFWEQYLTIPLIEHFPFDKNYLQPFFPVMLIMWILHNRVLKWKKSQMAVFVRLLIAVAFEAISINYF
jgi:hypothetical protein